MLRTMGRSSEHNEDLRMRSLDLHKLQRSLEAISKQLQITRSSVQITVRKRLTDVSPLCRGLKENPNCQPQMTGNWLGCSGTTL